MNNDILNELRQLRAELQHLKTEIQPRLERLEAHIDFIEDTYDGLRRPLDYVKNYFSKPLIGSAETKK